ncbi:MAG: hypothetical protein JSV52_07725 [Candidatus Zixiibacteriota bacterium]|nr:MAG: hypothetical protein JSV52_07725 [candidate division Zixibacteria bacterium]
MEKISEYQTLLNETVAKISGEELSTLDFDQLKDLLSEVVTLLDEVGGTFEGLKCLREDYIARISGMEKAIAIAGRASDGLSRALELTDALPTLSAGELIEQYNRTQAKFRDAFPTSYGILQKRQTGRGKQNLSEYK